MFVPISDRIDLRNKKFKNGSTTDWVKESGKFVALDGVLAKNTLQLMEFISLSRKGMKTKQGNLMEITDVLRGD